MGSTFTAKSYRSGDGETIELAGELDFATVAELKSLLDRMLVIPEYLVLETAGLTFIDSTGLRLLLRASDMVPGRVEIRNASLPMRRILEITGVLDRFILDTVAEHQGMAARPLPLVQRTMSANFGDERLKEDVLGQKLNA